MWVSVHFRFHQINGTVIISGLPWLPKRNHHSRRQHIGNVRSHLFTEMPWLLMIGVLKGDLILYGEISTTTVPLWLFQLNQMIFTSLSGSTTEKRARKLVVIRHCTGKLHWELWWNIKNTGWIKYGCRLWRVWRVQPTQRCFGVQYFSTNSTGFKKKSDWMKAYEKMVLLLTWFVASLDSPLMSLWPQSLDTSPLRHSMMFILWDGDEAAYPFGPDHFVIGKSWPRCVLRFRGQVRSHHDILPSSTLLSKQEQEKQDGDGSNAKNSWRPGGVILFICFLFQLFFLSDFLSNIVAAYPHLSI